MRRNFGPSILLCALLLGAGCGPSEREPAEAQGQAAAAEAEWSWLQQTKQALDEKRERLARSTAAPPQGQPAPSSNSTNTAAALRTEVGDLSEEFRRRLIDFINANPPVEGEPPSGRQLEAIRMKTDEDILIAREHIERGGDFRRAIDIYEAALAVDPENPRLPEELERAKAHRYMTAERFAQVQEGMTQDQVRALLGQPNLHNIREYPQRGVSAWFYTRDSQGGAAAVWFEKKGKGMAVYQADFEAVTPGKPQPAAPPAGPPAP